MPEFDNFGDTTQRSISFGSDSHAIVPACLMLAMFVVYVQRLIRLLEILGDLRERIRARWR